MFIYEKKLQYPVKIANCNPKLASFIISQYGGPDGELGASLRYLSQRYSMPYPELKGLLTDIGTEELGHLEMIGAIVHQLTRNLNDEQVREYTMGRTTIRAVDDISFTIPEGKYTIILGASGAGKSTVLNILGGMDSPTSGRVTVNGREISGFNKRQLTEYRRESIGFVFQFYNLMPNLTVLENVELASQICKNPLDSRQVLAMVGLGDRLNNFPAQCSGGEQQRGAIARALAKNPDVLLCDEPTGALDYQTGKAILALLYDLCKKSRKTVVVVTHNGALAPTADVLIRMKSGKIESFEENPSPVPVQELEW